MLHFKINYYYQLRHLKRYGRRYILSQFIQNVSLQNNYYKNNLLLKQIAYGRDLNLYNGRRFMLGRPWRGQRTRTNARTVKKFINVFKKNI